MAPQLTFGEILRDARERKGIDLPAAARRLRIRPDILQAIEMSDFSRMPPRGYTRNMVNAYARLVGLNPTDITRMYLDAAYAYQVGRARQEQPAAAAGFDMGSQTRRGQRSRDRSGQPDYRTERQQGAGRPLYTDARADAYRTSPTAENRLYSERQTHSSRRSALPNSQYTNFYAGPTAPRGIASRLPFIVAGAIILILLIVILMMVFGGRNSQSEDVPKVPVTGLVDPEQSSSGSTEGEQQTITAPVAPTAAVFKYEVAQGQSAYIEIYVDDGGASVAEVVAGPASDTFDVTGTLRFVTTNPSGVTITVDGTAVTPVDEYGRGVYTYTVDFAQILAQWQTDNAAAIAAAAAANQAATSGSTSGTSSSSTSSSASTS